MKEDYLWDEKKDDEGRRDDLSLFLPQKYQHG